ncbi:hypothetical protein [Pseudomonas sp. UBA6310]|uniref:hypothetical protein n=1 Tax=Pseudomonas sp. UBA6310 TaxID=1947327 RepID=UPI00257F8549|nr:hypothetical protein [Pseudomonas sp. UBA6310]
MELDQAVAQGERLSVQRFYVNANGAFIGSWVDAPEPPAGGIEVPLGPEWADQVWNFRTETYGPSLYGSTSDEDAWRESELLLIAEQLLMIEDNDPAAAPGSAAQWRAYRVAVRAWKAGSGDFPFGSRPTSPAALEGATA